MCGRYTLILDGERVAVAMGWILRLPAYPELGPRYNIAPTQPVLAARRAGVETEVVALRWGLVPHWAKDPKVGAKMINARAETLLERPAFREAAWARRCLVLADGFYEWQTTGSKVKQPWHIRAPDRGLLTFAGLWERWGKGIKAIESCTIITVPGNITLRGIHERMPAIIPAGDRDAWLDVNRAKPGDALRLLRPAPAELLEAVPVSTAVNQVASDGPDLVASIEQEGFRFS